MISKRLIKKLENKLIKTHKPKVYMEKLIENYHTQEISPMGGWLMTKNGAKEITNQEIEQLKKEKAICRDQITVISFGDKSLVENPQYA